jgi:hypothetical protein
MGFSPWWFAPPVLITLGAVIVCSILKPSLGRKLGGAYFSVIFLIGAVRGIVFGHMSGKGCPTLEGHDAAIYGAGLLVCAIVILFVSVRNK